MTASVHRLDDFGHLVDAGDDSGGQFVEPRVDGVPLLDGERVCGLKKRYVGVNAAGVDRCVV